MHLMNSEPNNMPTEKNVKTHNDKIEKDKQCTTYFRLDAQCGLKSYICGAFTLAQSHFLSYKEHRSSLHVFFC